MIEICKQITINLFWVLAAMIEIAMGTLLVLAIISSLVDKLTGNKDHEDEDI